MSRDQRRRTAEELIDELERKPGFLEQQRRRTAEREEARRRYAEAAAGLLAELEDGGFSVETMAQLRESGNESAVPVLAKWLSAIEYLPLKRDLIAVLGSPWARPVAARPLLDEFRRIDPAEDTSEASLRWSIGDALEHVADESVIDDLIEIATDPGHGRHRALVVIALGNLTKTRARVLPVLLTLLDDEVVAPYAVIALGKLKAPEARSAVEQFLDHPEPWVRKEAKRTLTKLPA